LLHDMKSVAAVLLFLFGLVAQAAAGGYTLENRPTVVFKGGVERMTPYPQSKRSTSVWVSDACWRDCNSSCSWKMEYCVRGNAADTCRPHFDNCNRACQRECRGFSAGPLGGPLVGLVDWY
jgi:hypothetical protein